MQSDAPITDAVPLQLAVGMRYNLLWECVALRSIKQPCLAALPINAEALHKVWIAVPLEAPAHKVGPICIAKACSGTMLMGPCECEHLCSARTHIGSRCSMIFWNIHVLLCSHEFLFTYARVLAATCG